ncbi:MAG: hypothetical protein IJS28_10395 [Synergistaceae bacterium]|nr:hypothetical protein [Synergistaceae bacterium]
MWFSKKTTIFKRKDRETWQRIRDVLKSSGIKGVRSGHYSADSLCACGCGPKLDPRNFGAGGYIDRDIYYVDVRQEDEERAKTILAENGINAAVDADPVGKLGRML